MQNWADPIFPANEGRNGAEDSMSCLPYAFGVVFYGGVDAERETSEGERNKGGILVCNDTKSVVRVLFYLYQHVKLISRVKACRLSLWRQSMCLTRRLLSLIKR